MRIRAIAAIVGAAIAPIAVAAPAVAAAATQSNHIEVRHYSPDSGYVRDLMLRCGNQGFVIREGHSSTEFRHVRFHPDCEGVTSIYVRSGEEWWTKSGGTWHKRFDETGWHNLPSNWSDGEGVTLRED